MAEDENGFERAAPVRTLVQKVSGGHFLARGRIHDLSDASGTGADGRAFGVVEESEGAECCRLRNSGFEQFKCGADERRLPPARWRQHLNLSFPKGKRDGNRIPHPLPKNPDRSCGRDFYFPMGENP